MALRRVGGGDYVVQLKQRAIEYVVLKIDGIRVCALLTGYRQVPARVGLFGVSNHEDVGVLRHRMTLEAQRLQHNSAKLRARLSGGSLNAKAAPDAPLNHHL